MTGAIDDSARFLPVVVGLALLASFVAACGSDGSLKGEDYGDLLASPAGLVLVEGEHPSGWGRPECNTCHESRSIHTVNRTSLPDCHPDASSGEACLDLPAVRRLVRRDGESSCAQCHGANGVAR